MLERILKKSKLAFLSALLAVSLESRLSSADNYTVEPIGNEYRCKLDGMHFMTVPKDVGIFSVRPHPGDDVNGWGSTLYIMPFLPGAILKNSTINGITANLNGIHIDAKGKVSSGESSTYGDWTSVSDFKYDAGKKSVSGQGNYNIVLQGPLAIVSNSSEYVKQKSPRLFDIIKRNSILSFGDLNLYKIASNYLDDVPLLGNGVGDTGDMRHADALLDTAFFRWIPPLQPGHFPGIFTDNLSVYVVGDYNHVDTVAQGYARIEPAKKPSMRFDLHSRIPSTNMIFGAIYDTSKAQDFWEDNVGITPLILQSSTQTIFDFDFVFYSISPENTAVKRSSWMNYK